MYAAASTATTAAARRHTWRPNRSASTDAGIATSRLTTPCAPVASPTLRLLSFVIISMYVAKGICASSDEYIESIGAYIRVRKTLWLSGARRGREGPMAAMSLITLDAEADVAEASPRPRRGGSSSEFPCRRDQRASSHAIETALQVLPE